MSNTQIIRIFFFRKCWISIDLWYNFFFGIPMCRINHIHHWIQLTNKNRKILFMQSLQNNNPHFIIDILNIAFRSKTWNSSINIYDENYNGNEFCYCCCCCCCCLLAFYSLNSSQASDENKMCSTLYCCCCSQKENNSQRNKNSQIYKSKIK